MKSVTECPIDQLRPLVDDTLDAKLVDEVVQHLDECESCRQRVDQFAGAAEDWAIASEALSSQSDFRISGVTGNGSPLDLPRTSVQFDLNGLLQLLAPTDDPRAAGRLGTFEVTGIVGSGGMGIVLKAREPALDRFVAIKILAPHLASSATARKRFAREARAAAAVIHDNVIAIYQVAHWNDLPYLVMPYLPDPTLQQRIDEEGSLDLEETLLIGMQIARGLSAAHSQGLIHRDVKPANVLLSKGTARAVITDFGLARTMDDASLTRVGMLAGTPHYMSPEQARGESVDPRSDLFSLGSVLFAMTSGRPPIDNELGSETVGRIATGELPSLSEVSPDSPEWFVRLVEWMHQRDAKRRPGSADEVAHLLEQCLSHVRQPDQHELPEILVSKAKPSRRALIIGCVMIAAVIILTASIFIRPFSDATQKRPDVLATEPVGNSARPEGTPEQLASNMPNRIDKETGEGIDDSLYEWDALEKQMSDLEAETSRIESRLRDDMNSTTPFFPENQQ